MNKKTADCPTVMIAAALMLGAMATGSNVEASTLYGHHWDDGTLFRIDTTAQTVTAVGSDYRNGPEIQITPNGSNIYISQPFGSEGPRLSSIDPVTGLTTGHPLSLSNFPTQTNALTAMEFVGSALYASAHETESNSNPGVLVTVDLNTGALTEIGGMTGMNRPSGGMDYFNGVMYAVTATNNNDSSLFTIDLGTGAATLVASLKIGGGQTDLVSGLAHADGTMFALRSAFDEPADANLYSVNLATGDMTVLFDLGVEMNSLTAVPLPGSLVLFGFALAGLGFARRRSNA